jgi:hypothetical protein
MHLRGSPDILFEISVHFIYPNKDDQDLIVELYAVPGKIMVPEILFEPLVFIHIILLSCFNGLFTLFKF